MYLELRYTYHLVTLQVYHQLSEFVLIVSQPASAGDIK